MRGVSIREKRVIVVGAGMGGLSAAIALAVGGAKVLVLERSVAPGGKARAVEVGGTSLDAGPTVLTMPWVFDELFELAGGSFRSDVALERANVLARHAWMDGTTLDLFADRRASADAIGRVFGAHEARAYADFCAYGKRIYETTETPFLKSQRPTMATVVKQLGIRGVAALATIDSHRTMWRSLEQHFASPRLRQLFARYATYVGSSPFEAPATLNLVAHVEAEGVFRAEGGMHGLARALERLALRVGVEFRYGEEVERILAERGQAAGVITRGATYPADAVVFNGDVSALGAGLLGPDVAKAASETPLGARSLSAITWMMVVKSKEFPLLHHNVFFSNDYPAEFEDIFRGERAPREPTVYICAQDRGDHASLANRERVFLLVNAPATGDDASRWTKAHVDASFASALSVVGRAGLTLEPEASVCVTPADFHRLFPGSGGALYGPRSKGAMSSFSRHGARSKIPRLYFAGGSVHPGAGVPMAALSGRLAAAEVRADLAF
jgi:1-hydroxycarotenoid 3,4-desaturase